MMQRAFLFFLCLCGFALIPASTGNGQPSVPKKEQPLVGLSEGEKLLLEMERKLLDAKSLRITFEITASDFGGPNGVYSGVLETAPGNRCRTEVLAIGGEKGVAQEKFTEVSDGTKNRLVEGK